MTEEKIRNEEKIKTEGNSVMEADTQPGEKIKTELLQNPGNGYPESSYSESNCPEYLRERYEALKAKVTERKGQWQALMEFLEQETSWLTAPASTRFHLCCEHGLLEHSINVAETLLRLKALLAPEISDESCVVTALLHDLGKAGVPGNPQYLPNEPSEKQKAAGFPASKPYRLIMIWFT